MGSASDGIKARVFLINYMVIASALGLAAVIAFMPWTRHNVNEYRHAVLRGALLVILSSLWSFKLQQKTLQLIWSLIGFSTIALSFYVSTISIDCFHNESTVSIDWVYFIAPSLVSVLCLLAAFTIKKNILKEFVWINTFFVIANLICAIYFGSSHPYGKLALIVFFGQFVFSVMGMSTLYIEIGEETENISEVQAEMALYILQFGFFAAYACTSCFIEYRNECTTSNDYYDNNFNSEVDVNRTSVSCNQTVWNIDI